MGGAFFTEGNATQYAEFNIYADTESASVVFNSKLNINKSNDKDIYLEKGIKQETQNETNISILNRLYSYDWLSRIAKILDKEYLTLDRDDIKERVHYKKRKEPILDKVLSKSIILTRQIYSFTFIKVPIVLLGLFKDNNNNDNDNDNKLECIKLSKIDKVKGIKYRKYLYKRFKSYQQRYYKSSWEWFGWL